MACTQYDRDMQEAEIDHLETKIENLESYNEELYADISTLVTTVKGLEKKISLLEHDLDRANDYRWRNEDS